MTKIEALKKARENFDGESTEYALLTLILEDDLGEQEIKLPIRDRDGNPMNVGDNFQYLEGLQYEQTLFIEEKYGRPWIRFSNGGRDIPLADFWYAPTDEKNSKLNK